MSIVPPPQVTVKELVTLGATDGLFFARSFFPKTMRQSSPIAHRTMWNNLDNPTIRYYMAEAFRGSAKTTNCRVFAARRISYNVSRTILYIGASEDHASRSIQWLRGQVERNKLWASAFALRPGKKWTDTEIEIRHGVDDAPIWILGVGITGNLRGINFDDYRPDLIICDDVLTDENTATREQREKTINLVLGAVKESLTPATEEPNAKMILLQTPMHFEDVAAEIKKDKQWITDSFPCWTPETVDAPADEQISSWPERYPTLVLRQEKAAAAARNRLSIFTREMECKLTSREKTAFKIAWLILRKAPPPLMPCVLAIDPVPPPSAAELAKNLIGKDYECHAVVGRLGPDFHVLEYMTNKGHQPNWTVATAIDLATRYRVMRIIVESIAYQRVLNYMLTQEMQRRGIFFPLVPITGDKRSKYNKITGELSGIAAHGHFHAGENMVDLIDQFSNYPSVAHDDVLDAVQMGVHDMANPFLELGTDEYSDLSGDEYKDFAFGGAP